MYTPVIDSVFTSFNRVGPSMQGFNERGIKTVPEATFHFPRYHSNKKGVIPMQESGRVIEG